MAGNPCSWPLKYLQWGTKIEFSIKSWGHRYLGYFNVPLMLTQGITVTDDSLVHFMPDTTPRAAKKVCLIFLSLSVVWTSVNDQNSLPDLHLVTFFPINPQVWMSQLYQRLYFVAAEVLPLLYRINLLLKPIRATAAFRAYHACNISKTTAAFKTSLLHLRQACYIEEKLAAFKTGLLHLKEACCV